MAQMGGAVRALVSGVVVCLVVLGLGSTPADASVRAALITPTITWTPTVTTVAGSAASLTPSPLARTTPTVAGAITYAVAGGTASCSVNATTAVLTWTSAGTCYVKATAAATSVYASVSTYVKFTITQVAQARLSISNSVRTGSVGTPIQLTTTGGSGTGAVTFAVTGLNCAVSGSTLTATRVTTCSVTATKAASGVYTATTSSAVSFSFPTYAQAPLLISNAVTTSVVGTPITLTTSGGSGTGAVTFAATGTGCSITGSVLSASQPTVCTVVATKAASAKFAAATSAPVPFTFTGLPQAALSITNTTLSEFAGTSVTLVASGGSGTGAVTFAATGTGCSVAGSVLSADQPTTCSVVATKAASGAYAAVSSPAVVFSFVGVAQEALAIANPTLTELAGTPVTLTVTGGSGTGALTFAATGIGCSVLGDQLSVTLPTTCSVVATKAASGIYAAAESPAVVFTFTGIAQEPVVITNTILTGFTGTPISLTATGGSGTGKLTFAVTGAGCSVSGTTLSAGQAATCTVIATKTAAGVYEEESSLPVVFTILFAGVDVPTSMFGVHYAPQTIGQGSLTPNLIRLWDVSVSWRDVNPARGTFVWTDLDARIAEVEALGARPILVLGMTPQWAASSTDGDPLYGVGSASAPADMADYTAYVTAVASRYQGRIEGYEVWNEANLQTFWTGTPDQMAELTQRAHDAVAAADPGAQVIAASTTLRLSGSLKNFTNPYYAALMARGWPIDAFAIHSYPSGIGTPVDRVKLIGNWKAMLKTVSGTTAEALGKAVLDTEVNFGLAGPGVTPGTDFDDATGAGYLARAYVDSLRLGISSTIWYIWTAGFFDVVGVQMHSGTPAVNHAYSEVQSWLAGSKFRECTSAGGVTQCAFTRDGDPFVIAFADAEGTAFSAGEGTATFLDGSSAEGSSVTTLGFAPVRFD
jgi:hypothetical protein